MLLANYKNKLAGLMLLSVLAIFILTILPSFHQRIAVSVTPELPDALMEDVVALVFDKQGKPKMKIVAPKMVHFAKNDMTKLVTPQLTLYRKSPTPWFVTSKSAEATKGADQINFWDDVVVQHAADENNPATIIKTPTLTVNPNAQIAETNDFIILTQPNIVIKGVGMHADMNNGDIKLLSQARGEYVPNS